MSAIWLHYTLYCWKFQLELLTWDQTGPLGESKGPSVRRSGESDVESWYLQGCSPRLCQLSTDGLVSVSKYWTYWSHAEDMCPVNWCSIFFNRGWLKCTASMVVRREKLGGGPSDQLVDVLGIMSRALFLGSSEFIQLCCVHAKGCHARDRRHEPYGWRMRTTRGKRICHVGQVSPIWCTSIRIVRGYEHHLFAGVNT
jgi:hypothetical protein